MKKILLILLASILLGGCADYKELNSLSYITGMGIDYQDEEFIVTYEIMDNKKEGNTITTETYIIEGKGKTNYEAQMNATEKLSATPYFSHTQIIILTEEVVNNHINDITDYIIRNPMLNEEFQFVMTSENTPKEIFETTTKQWPATSFYIYSLVNDNTHSENYYIHLPFAIFTQKLNEKKVDPIISVIKTKDDEILLDSSAVFSNGKLKTLIDNNFSNIYNALIKSSTNVMITDEYKNNSIETNVKFSNTTIEINDTEIDININAAAEIKKSPIDLNLHDNESYNIISDILNENIEDKIYNFMKICQENNTDIVGLENLYYIKYRKENNDLWLNAKINVNINTSIARKGLIYNVYN